MTRRDHLKLVGIIHTAWNLLGILAAGGVLLFWLFIAGAAGGVVGHEHGRDQGAAAAATMGVLGLIVASVIAVPAIPGFVGGVALLKGWRWSRPLLIVVSAVQILTLIPVSVLLGGYSLWVLWPDETADALEKRDVAWLPAD